MPSKDEELPDIKMLEKEDSSDPMNKLSNSSVSIIDMASSDALGLCTVSPPLKHNSSDNSSIVSNIVDVDSLVSELRENLQLSTNTPLPALQSSNTISSIPLPSSLKIRSAHHRGTRPTPYRVPCRSVSEPAYEYCYRHRCHYCQDCSSRAIRKKVRFHVESAYYDQQEYERFDDLIKRQSLISEAVRRLQFDIKITGEPSKPKFTYESDEEDCSKSCNNYQHICGIHKLT